MAGEIATTIDAGNGSDCGGSICGTNTGDGRRVSGVGPVRGILRQPILCCDHLG